MGQPVQTPFVTLLLQTKAFRKRRFISKFLRVFLFLFRRPKGIGATGPRASEREICLWEGLCVGGFSEGKTEVFRGLQRFLEVFRDLFRGFQRCPRWGGWVIRKLFRNLVTIFFKKHIFGKLVHIFRKLVHVFIFIWKLVSRTLTQEIWGHYGNRGFAMILKELPCSLPGLHFIILFSGNYHRLKFMGGSFCYLQLELFCLQLSFFAYSPLRPLVHALSHCKQKSSNCK